MRRQRFLDEPEAYDEDGVRYDDEPKEIRMPGWRNPLWKPPSEWRIVGKAKKPGRSARKNDTLIVAELTRARRRIDRERSRRRYDAVHRTVQA